MKKSKKLSAIFLAAALAFCLAACGTEDMDDDVETQTEPPAPVETEAVTEAPVEPPIEVGRFCEPEDMPEADCPEFTDESLAIEADGEKYTLGWLYEHNIYDWREAGITFDQINERSEDILWLDYSDEAFQAIKAKVSAFTELMMLSPVADVTPKSGEIVVSSSDGSDDVSYGIDWLSSHNATDYTEAGITADVVKQYLDSLKDDFWYTKQYRWIEVVYDRLVNGF